MARFQQSHDNLIGKPVGKTVGFDAHKTSPMSFHVDIPIRCLIFSNFETFYKKTTCSLTLADAMCIFLSRRDLLCQKYHDQLTKCFVLLKLKI